MAWFRKKRTSKRAVGDRRPDMPSGLWTKCNNCREIVYRKEILRNASVCPKCNYHFRISATDRLSLLCDDAEWAEFGDQMAPTDSLRFRDTKRYRDRLADYQKRTGLNDAVITAEARLDGIAVVFAAMEYGFMGGSMGSVVGEKITLAAERALAQRVPLIVVSCSGGARMQEGAQSLMQMAKISAALSRLSAASLPFISVLTDPTTGGVTASFAMLGDMNIAEPQALIGFAGPRVIEQTIRERLPEGFQRSEFLLTHGMLDVVVPRKELKQTLATVLRHLGAAKEETLATTPPLTADEVSP
ncbi:MAG TPA: acetyl-CoA carboxylase, carboxyltransferase subunit beta [Acidobacteriota bacterium]|nr:acetyl-CoA carboxylase, carboxyltransferase subunit beta [Acidobacteriota bacterium]